MTDIVLRKRSRLPAYLAAALLLAGAAWAGTWHFATARLAAALDTWIAREHEAGRDWACPERAISGFPLRIEIVCDAPTLTIAGADGATRIGARRIATVAQVWQPNQADVAITTPAFATRADGSVATLDAGGASAQLRVSPLDYPKVLDRLSLSFVDPVVTVTAAGQVAASARAAKVEAHLRATAGRAKADGAFDIAATVRQLNSPMLDALAKTGDPVEAELAALVIGLDLPGRGNGVARLEAWRLANGALDVTRLSLVKGAAKLETSGRLSLDAEHRAAGQIDVKAEGLDALLAQFGIPAAKLDIGSALSMLAGKKKQADPQAVATAAPSIRLPLVLREGRIYVGPIPTPVKLVPLY